MVLRNTIKEMEGLLLQMATDLPKATKGNKAASQRVRTFSIRFSKIAKLYRKESIQNEKKVVKKEKPTIHKPIKRKSWKSSSKRKRA